MQLEFFIIGGCTIQVLYSRIMSRVVLALDNAEVRPKASTALGFISDSMLLLLTFQFHTLPYVSFRW